MNIRMFIAQMFGANAAPHAQPSQDAHGPQSATQGAPGTAGQTPGIGKTQLDRLMASADKLDRIAPPPMHQVQSGETLTSIATAYGTNWQNLARINGLGTADAVQVGAMLRLPAGDAPNVASGINPQLPSHLGEVSSGMANTPATPNPIGAATAALAALPLSAQTGAAPPPAAIHTNPDAGKGEDFSLWCKVAICPNLNPDTSRHIWPCNACGRSGRADAVHLQ